MNSARQPKPLILIWLWPVVLLFSALYVVYVLSTSSPFYSNVMELLPEDEQHPVLHKLTREMAAGFENRLLILLKADSDQQSLQQAKTLQSQLLALPGMASAQTNTEWLSRLADVYRPYLGVMLDQESRQRLQHLSAEQLADQALRQLISPVATPRLYAFQQDPFALGTAWLNNLVADFQFSLFQGFPVVNYQGERWMVVTAELQASAFDFSLQQQLTQLVSRQQQLHPVTEWLTSGMIFHAAAGAAQAKQEISTVGLGSLIGILVLVLVVFRTVKPLGLIVLVLGGGSLFALTVSLLVFERIHLITLVFGSTLLGVSVDYAFHFLVKARRYGGGRQAIQAIQLALAVGALTSITAYLMQWLAPFPGLRQMALFSASGLLGAWLTLLFVGQWYAPLSAVNKANNSQSGRHSPFGSFLLRYCRVFSVRRPLISGLLGIVTLAAVGVILVKGSNDDIASLNTSDTALLEAEAAVQERLHFPSSHQFFLVSGADPQSLLQQLALLQQVLLETPVVSRTSSLVDYVPPELQQRQDRQLVTSKLYADSGALVELCQRLAMDCESQRHALIKSESWLQPQDLLHSPVSGVMPPLLKEGEQWYSLLSLNTTGVAQQTLEDIAARWPQVEFIDQSDNLSSLLARYRQQVSVILLATLGGLGLVMLWRYRQQAWRMLLPLYLSLVIAIACAALSGGVTLFHMAALLLVLGIGVDTGVFYLEVGLQPDSWLAASLASLTSMLAFGLLSLSAVPVLQQFGLVVLSGILCCWLVTPMFFTPQHKG